MRLLLFIAIVGFIFSCSSSVSTSEQITTGDTLQTQSGLQYSFISKGSGLKVEKGSFVKTKLSLMVDDSVVWTSYESEDSVFSFIVGESSVIKGFEEMAFLMSEGDNVIAILPDSLAYGARGAGNVIPPHATLVYDHYEMVYVSAPRTNPVDTLLATYLTNGIDGFKMRFDSVMAETETYHEWGPFFEQSLIRKLERDSLYSEEVQIATYLGKKFSRYRTLSYVAFGHYNNKNYNEALASIDEILSEYQVSSGDSTVLVEFRQELLDSLNVN